jgi:CRP/FNR family cyclic AMP-dependent transcriptional regulator
MPEDPQQKQDLLSHLRAIPLFAKVVETDLEAIASQLIERRYAKDTVVVEEGLAGEYMYVIRTGRVKVTKASDDGREKIMDFLEAGDFFGEMSLLDKAPRSATVRTLEPARLMALSRVAFLDLLTRSSSLSLAVIRVLTHRLRDADDQASSMSFHRVEDRVKNLFQRLARADEGDGGALLTPLLTHQQIADMVGTSRETVTRAVKNLKQDGWLEQHGKRYAIGA